MVDAIKEQRLKELLVVVREFDTTLVQVREQELLIDNFKALIRTDSLRRYHKKWIAFSLALDLYRISLVDIQRFISEKPILVARTRPLDSELAKRIDLLELPPRGELEVLEPIARMLGEDPALAISYIKTHYQEIMQNLELSMIRKQLMNWEG